MTKNHALLARGGRSKGFSLVELLTAMTILVIIVLLMVMIFKDADRIWFTGSGRALNSTAGRATLNLISHDLQYAVADSILSFAIRPDRNGCSSYGLPNDEICFVALQHDSSGDSRRTAREVHYWVRPSTTRTGTYELVRGYYSSEILNNPAAHCYFNKRWYETGGGNPGRPAGYVIAENVAGLDFVAAEATNVTFFGSGCPNVSFRDISPYYSTNRNNLLPEYVDIYLELLSEVDAGRAAALAYNAGEQRKYVEEKHRRFVDRVYFNNKDGYRKR